MSLRQLMVMGIALYTSRVILSALGEVNYGVYNVVAGVSTTFIFFSAALASSTQRFLNIEMVREGGQNLWKVFSLNFWFYALLAGAVIIVGAALGPWLVFDVLNIPVHTKTAALIVFYSTIVCLAMTVMASVYESVLIARENMKAYAYIGIFDAVAKLAIAYIITVSPEKLVTYGLLMVVAILLPKIFLVVYCLRRYPESRPRWFWNVSMLKELMGFSGWNIYSGVSWIINFQGLDIALNIFFGPIINAARGIAQQVNSAVSNFSTNFAIAIRPQLIKTYAEGDMDEERRLLSMGSRGAYFLLWILALPLMVRIDYVLHLWLEEVPEYTASFVVWTLVFLCVNTLFNPMQNVAHATGDLKRFSLWGVNAFVIACPISILILWMGAPPWSIYPVLIITRLASTIIPIYTLRPYIKIGFGLYIAKILLPIVAVSAVSLGIAYGVNMIFPENFGGLVAFGAITFVLTLAVILYVGLTKVERISVINKVRTKFLHR